MTVEEILAQSRTKTWKIQQLILLGKTRNEIAALQVLGAYGAIQNVYAAMQRNGQLPSRTTPQASPRQTSSQIISRNVQRISRDASAPATPTTTPTVAIPPPQTATNQPQRENAGNLISVIGNRQLKPVTEKFGIEIEAFNVTRPTLRDALVNMGIACEVEDYNHRTRPQWKLVTDGSLQGTNPFELVSPILVGQDGLFQLKKVCTVLQMQNARVNNSCGLHVHFDASQITFPILQNILINYMNFEEEIDSFLPHSRRNNSYTQSIKNHRTAVENARTMQGLISAFDGRYYKVNLQSYSRHNTIEFRQHSGTVEYEKIENWVIFLHNLIEYSKNYKFPRSEANFEGLKKLNQKVVYDFLITRINQIAA
ncbi:putative amidoligase enzyme [Arcicella aurantiaca]|uniref:Putative amidoligase enzyme n=1 Tax=Arcicella aurantiaca TaxID=591202 RepID=A0A316EUT4_9BACT|nr:amidoligase family protein [Arcicella aurantiaca]PWK27006.1 putative amidoligase enzyme [Arcicella aurantiaca]